MHAPNKAYYEEESEDSDEDVEEGLSDAVGVEDEEGETGGDDGVEEVEDVVAREVYVDGFGVVEGVAEEADDAVAGVVDHAGCQQGEEEGEDVEPDVGQAWGVGEVGDEDDGEEHEGRDDGLVGGVGEVGVAEGAVHGAGVDGGVEQVEDADLFVAQEDADESDGEGYEDEGPSGRALVLDGDFVGVLDGEQVVGEEAFVQHGFYTADGGEDGVVGAQCVQAVGGGVGKSCVGWQCVYLQHGLSDNCQFLYIHACIEGQDECVCA